MIPNLKWPKRFKKWWEQKQKPCSLTLQTVGTCYDLQKIYESLNKEYFGAELKLHISWFGKGVIVPKTRMLFGSYHHQHRLIKVNRLLDRQDVPEYFVRFIVYHEMLHYAHPPIRKRSGRRSIHHSEFKAREKQFQEYALAKQYLKKWKGLYVT